MGAFFLICKAKLSFIPNFIYMYMLNTIPIIYLTKLYFNILYRIPFSSQLFYQQYFLHLTDVPQQKLFEFFKKFQNI